MRRTTVTEVAGKAPMQATVAIAGDEVLVAWIDEVPAIIAPPPAGKKVGVAPSQPMKAPPPPQRQSDVFFALLDARGAVKARGSMPVSGLAQSPVARFDGTSWWVAWTEHRDDHEAVLAAKLTRAGQREGELVPVGQAWEGPVWVSLAAAGAITNVLISHPNAAPCVLSWAQLPQG